MKFRLWSAGFQHGMMLKQASKRRAGGRRFPALQDQSALIIRIMAPTHVGDYNILK